jgi:hypothetical protein
MRRLLTLGLSLTLALAAGLGAACSDELGIPITSGGGSGGSGGSEGGGGMATTQRPGEPQPLAVLDGWLVTDTQAGADQVLPAIEAGSFVMPVEGRDQSTGHNWQRLVQEVTDDPETGLPSCFDHVSETPAHRCELKSASRDLLYAAAIITPPEGHRVFARGDTVVNFYVDNAARQPGDFYHSRRMRAPLTTTDGPHLVVARALGGRNIPEIELWSTDAELVFNTRDVTAPQLIVGTTDAQYVGVPVLVMRDEAVSDLSAKVVADDNFSETVVAFDSLAPGAVTQLSFLLQPKKVELHDDPAAPLEVTLELSSPSLDWSYTTTIEIATVAAGSRYRRTRRSGVDGSTQYDAVMPPSGAQPTDGFGLILSLHGASVQASGQAAAYSPKTWAYLVAPTNRRPFGFDWEEWGRLDAIEALDHAMATLPIDEARVHLTGHSMGGHGSWNVGVHYSDRFGVIAPSAGWRQFTTYGGGAHPTGPVGRARAGSLTLDYVDNFAQNSVFIIHGSIDDNVSVAEGRAMFQTLQPITTELQYHEQPGANHWWDLDPNEEGADCVDWEPMITVMEGRARDPEPMAFNWISTSPWINPQRSFVRVLSEDNPMENVTVESVVNGTEITLTHTNVRSMRLDGAMLARNGIDTVSVDGTGYPTGGNIEIGPQTGKTPEVHGPLNQVFHKPFCVVWQENGPPVYREYARYLLSWWAVIGNGHGCGIPVSKLTQEIRDNRNLVFLGMYDPGNLPIEWSVDGVTIADEFFPDTAMAFVYPASNGRLNAHVSVSLGMGHLLFRYMPFSSRAGMPDYFVWDEDGGVANGFFDGDWQIDPAYAMGL